MAVNTLEVEEELSFDSEMSYKILMKEDSSVDSFKLKCKSNKVGKIERI